MANRTVLILAAGESARWENEPKQLLLVPSMNETIIKRIERQVRDRGGDPITVTHRRDIAANASRVFVPTNHEVTCATLLSTQKLWQEITVVLLGDVIYSQATMDRIFASRDNFAVFGNQWEIYSLSFMPEVHREIIEAATAASDYRMGKLRYFFNAYKGWDFECHHGDDLIFQEVRDWTMDVDTPDDYKSLHGIVTKGLLDDLP